MPEVPHLLPVALMNPAFYKADLVSRRQQFVSANAIQCSKTPHCNYVGVITSHKACVMQEQQRGDIHVYK